jgi:23S rRNA (cytosine1962-C5)-methyltransferase
VHRITLKRHEDKRITHGHLWVFSNEIAGITGEPKTGEVVAVYSAAGKFIGAGFYHPHSLIAVRILTRTEQPVDAAFITSRIERALRLRTTLYPGAECFRLVHGEADQLPGLIIDKYNDYCSLQIFSAGMEQYLPAICDTLESLFHCRGIAERNESPLRSLENLELRKGVVRGAVAPVVISEHGLRYTIDLLEGQKTGFFLDQRENRHSIRRYATGQRVLDCFCNEGGFALNAAAAGAQEVTGVDISAPTIDRATQNSRLNNLSVQTEFVVGDVFDYLKSCTDSGKRFGLIILDPPSFAKNRKTVRQAVRGYRQLHAAALPLVADGGYLATASCSHHIFEETFRDIIHASAEETGRSVARLEWHGAAPDHPVLPGMPETEYLKFGIYRVNSPL